MSSNCFKLGFREENKECLQTVSNWVSAFLRDEILSRAASRTLLHSPFDSK